MNKRHTEKPVQLTVRGVPSRVKKQLLLRAEREKKSLNSILVEVLSAAGGNESNTKFRDLKELSGTWVEDSDFDAAIEAQNQIDPALWP
jgi:plasmid stability protein